MATRPVTYADLFDPNYVGSGPGAARRQYEIALLAKELQTISTRTHAPHTGGGVLGTIGLAGKQIGGALLNTIPSTFYAGGAAALATKKALHIPGGSYEPAKAIGASMYHGIGEDIHHPGQRPGYLLMDIANALALGGGAATRLGALGRAFKAGERVFPEGPPTPSSETVAPTPKLPRKAVKIPGAGRPRGTLAKGESIPLNDIVGQVNPSVQEYGQWIGSTERHHEALAGQPDPPHQRILDEQGRTVEQWTASTGDQIHLRWPRGTGDRGVAKVIHVDPTGAENPLFQIKIPKQHANEPGFDVKAGVLDFVARTSARELELAAKKNPIPEVQGGFSIEKFSKMAENAAAYREVAGQAPKAIAKTRTTKAPEAPIVTGEPANPLDPNFHHTGHAHALLDQVDELRKKRVTKAETIQKRMGLPTVDEAQALHGAAILREQERALAAEAVAAQSVPPSGPKLKVKPAKKQTAAEAKAISAAADKAAEAARKRGAGAQERPPETEAARQQAMRAQRIRDAEAGVVTPPVKAISKIKPAAMIDAVQAYRSNTKIGSAALVRKLEVHHPEGVQVEPGKLMSHVEKLAEKAKAVEVKEAAVKKGTTPSERMTASRESQAKRLTEAKRLGKTEDVAKLEKSIAALDERLKPPKQTKRFQEQVAKNRLATKPAEEQRAHGVSQHIIDAGKELVEADPSLLAEGEGTRLKALTRKHAEALKEQSGHKGKTTIPAKVTPKEFQDLIAGKGSTALKPMRDVHGYAPREVPATPATEVKTKAGETVKIPARKATKIPGDIGLVEKAIRGDKAAYADLTGRLSYYKKVGAAASDIQELEKAVAEVKSGLKGEPPGPETVVKKTRAKPREEGTDQRAQKESPRDTGMNDRALGINPNHLKEAGVPEQDMQSVADEIRRLHEDKREYGKTPKASEIANVFTDRYGETHGNEMFRKFFGPGGGAADIPLGRRVAAGLHAFVAPPPAGVTVHRLETYQQPLVGGGRKEITYPVFTHNSRNSIVRAGVRLGYKTLDEGKDAGVLPKITPGWAKRLIDGTPDTPGGHLHRRATYVRKMVESESAMADVEKVGIARWKRAKQKGRVETYIQGEYDRIIREAHEKWDKAGRKGKPWDYMDSFNQVAVIGALFLKPAYISANLMGQMEIALVDHAWNPVSVAKSWMLSRETFKKYPELRGRILGGVSGGKGITGSFGFEKGIQNKAGKAVQAVYRGFATEGIGAKVKRGGPSYGFKRGDQRGVRGVRFGKGGKIIPASEKILDSPFRQNAFFNEARRHGFKTAEDIHDLMTTKELGGKRLEIYSRANKNAIDYGNLGKTERDFVRRVIFFYPWIKASTVWTARSITEHPVQATVRLQGTRYAQEKEKKDLGPLPAYLQGVFKVGSVNDKDLGKVPLVMNPAAITATGSAGQVAQYLGGALSGSGSSTALLSQFFNPTVSAGVQVATGADPFTGRKIQPGEGLHVGIPGTGVGHTFTDPVGKFVNAFGDIIAPAKLYSDIKRTRGLRKGVGDVQQTQLPYGGGERFGRYLGPGFGELPALVGKKGHPLAEYRINPKETASRAFAEDQSSRSAYERAIYKHAQFTKDFTQATREVGITKGNEQLPPEVKEAIRVRGIREAELATLKHEVKRNPTPREVFTADMALATRLKKITTAEAEALIKQTYGMPDHLLKKVDRTLRDAYLGGKILTVYRGVVNKVKTAQGKPTISLP